MIDVTFVRHGETKTNAAGITQGWGPGELTAEGIEMTKKVGIRLKSEKFTRIFSSDLQRCKDTAENILKAAEGEQPDVVFREDLRERDMGDMESQPWHLVMDMATEQKCSAYKVELPGAESYEDVVKRAGEFFDMICSFTGDEKVLVVCHGAWLKSLLRGYILDPANADKFQVDNFEKLYTLYKENIPPTTNTSVTKMVISERQNSKQTIVFSHIFDVSHLN